MKIDIRASGDEVIGLVLLSLVITGCTIMIVAVATAGGGAA